MTQFENFEYIIKVMLSCKTEIQLEKTLNWGTEFIKRNFSYNKKTFNDLDNILKKVYKKVQNDFIIDEYILQPHINTRMPIKPELLIIFNKEINNCTLDKKEELKNFIYNQNWTILKKE